MKSLQILILEDTIEDAQAIINVLSEKYTITLVSTLLKAKEMLTTCKFDLAIVDISIDGKLSGIEFAKHIQNSTSPIPFIFLTSMQSKTVFDQAKLTQPFTYLLKPFNHIELNYTIELALEKFFKQENTLRTNKGVISNAYIFVKKQHLICKINLDEIEYVEVEENYSTLYVSKQKYVVKKSLSKIKQILDSNRFEQIHRKFLINFNKVREINLSENTVYLNSGKQISISDRYKKQLTSSLNIIK